MIFASLPDINIINLIDVVLVAFLIYRLMLLIRDTRAVQLIKGLAVLLVGATVSDWLGLYTINWILKNIETMLIVAIPIVFQPELRRALEHLGRGKLFVRTSPFLGQEEANQLIGELSRSAQTLSNSRIGALIVVERQTGVKDYIETGVKIDGVASAELLVNIFMPNTPLHDGAVIIRASRIMAAGCFLPLTENSGLSKEIGTRHRAAIGISEQSDAVAIVVSEETGTISIATEGKLVRGYDEKTLRQQLYQLLIPENNRQKAFWNWRSNNERDQG